MEGENDNSADENYEPPKKIKSEWSRSYSNKAFHMMERMGYENDKGLGKMNQGRLEPVIAVQQDGRRGLGLKLSEITDEEWDTNCEQFHIPEKITWISKSNTENMEFPQSFEELKNWIHIDRKKLTIDEETMFCDEEILRLVLDSKQVFDTLDENDMRRARSRSNPYETIRSSIFLNRAAVKMANMDSMCDWMFTQPVDKNGTSLNENGLLYFADVCAGPGGFSEYVLYRKGWKAKGFGFTLRGANDFKLDKFFAGSPESFDPFYGINNDGDVYDRDNQDSFAEYVHKHTPTGVHFVMADGGFSVEGQENIQEILSKQLYLCQFLTALKILKVNGHFVCKLFDLFTAFSVGLVYLMYQSFEQITIIKPNSSRPANSERYLVCKWKKEDIQHVIEYMDYINDLINDQKECNDGNDVLEVVSLDVIMRDREFLDYIKESNNSIGSDQIIGLRKIAVFCRNIKLKETRQADCRKRCLDLWKLPDKLRQPPEVRTTERLLDEVLGQWSYDDKLLSLPAIEICSIERGLAPHVPSIHDWYFVPVGRVETSINVCSIFFCKSRGTLLRYTDTKKWEPVEYAFDVTPKSLFYGEIVYEFSGEGRTQTKVCALHIIDGIMLGGIDIRKLPLRERVHLCKQYCQSINKPYREGNLSIRSKALYKLKNLNKFFEDMRLYTLKDNTRRFGFEIASEEKFFVPGGVIMLCELSHNYFTRMSKNSKQLYYFDKTTKASFYMEQMPDEMKNMLLASFRNTFARRLLWKWTSIRQVELGINPSECDDDILYREDIVKFIETQLKFI